MMLGVITTTTHNRIVAQKDAEIAGLLSRLARSNDLMEVYDLHISRLERRLAPFTAPRARDDKGRFIKDTVA